MADIVINLLKSKSSVLTHDNIAIINDYNYKIIAGEQLATSFKLVYDKTEYANYSFSVEIVNAANKGVTIRQGTNPLTDIVDDEFLFPIGAAVKGYAKMTVSAVNNNNADQIVKWELIKIKVWETNPSWKDHIDPTTPYVTYEQFNALVQKVNKKTETLKFATEDDMLEYLDVGTLAGYPDLSTLVDGTIFVLAEEGKPDYWWDATNQVAYALEASGAGGGEQGAQGIPGTQIFYCDAVFTDDAVDVDVRDLDAISSNQPRTEPLAGDLVFVVRDGVSYFYVIDNITSTTATISMLGRLTGEQGADGVGVTSISGSNYTDEGEWTAVVLDVDYSDGTTGEIHFKVRNGADGYTPVKGVDYFTEDDKNDLVEEVLASLPVYNGEVLD